MFTSDFFIILVARLILICLYIIMLYKCRQCRLGVGRISIYIFVCMLNMIMTQTNNVYKLEIVRVLSFLSRTYTYIFYMVTAKDVCLMYTQNVILFLHGVSTSKVNYSENVGYFFYFSLLWYHRTVGYSWVFYNKYNFSRKLVTIWSFILIFILNNKYFSLSLYVDVSINYRGKEINQFSISSL